MWNQTVELDLPSCVFVASCAGVSWGWWFLPHVIFIGCHLPFCAVST